jgi:hypothetical protein
MSGIKYDCKKQFNFYVFQHVIILIKLNSVFIYALTYSPKANYKMSTSKDGIKKEPTPHTHTKLIQIKTARTQIILNKFNHANQ